MTGRHAYRPPEPAGEDPFERTRPDGPSETAGERREREEREEREAQARREAERRAMRPRDRRILEAIALLTLVPTLLVLGWVGDITMAEKIADPPEKATVVPRDTTATWQNVRWRLYAQAVGGPPAGYGSDAAELRLGLAMKPLNAAGVKLLTSFGLKYRLADSEGNVWTATGSTGEPPRAGRTRSITVRGALPRSKTGAVVLEVRAPVNPRPKGPVPLLRFER